MRRRVERIEAAQNGLLVGVQAAHELGIVKRRLPLGRAHSLKRMQTAGNELFSFRRHLLPLRKKSALYVLALFGRHTLPGARPVVHRVAFRRREVVPLLQVALNLSLALRRKALEALAVLQKTILLLRRHVPQVLPNTWRQPSQGSSVSLGPRCTGICSGSVRIGRRMFIFSRA